MELWELGGIKNGRIVKGFLVSGQQNLLDKLMKDFLSEADL